MNPTAFRSRVFAAGPDPATILASLQRGFDEFRTRNDADVEELRAGVDDVNQRIAALNLNSGGPAAGPGSQVGRQVRQAFGEFAQLGNPDALQRISPNAGMSRDSDPDGGFIVPDQLSTVILSAQRNISPLRRLANVVPTTSMSYKQPFSPSGAAAGWVGERQARPETAAPPLALIDIPAGEIYANPGVSQALIDDAAINVGDFLIAEISKEFEGQEGTAFINGNGINKPQGFLQVPANTTSDATRAFGTLEYLVSGGAADFHATYPADALIQLMFKVKAAYRQNGTWLMNSATLSLVSRFKDLENRYLLQPSIAKGVPPTLLGYPVEACEDMPDVGANAFPIAFGDFRAAYTITDRLGIRVLRDPYSNKPNVMFYTTKRVGGGLVDSNAIKLLKIST